jgi:hypothetical protein
MIAHHPPTESQIAARLLRAVLAKSFLEMIFICVVATLAAFSNFNPLLRGAIDVAEERRVAGWAYDPRAAGERLEVQLFIDDQFAASQRAGELRPDLVQAGAAASSAHGFTFALEPLGLAPGRHTAQVYVVHQAAGKHKVLVPLAREPRLFHVSR